MDKSLIKLHEQLKQLYIQLRRESKSKYNRINPFFEDLFDWKERGKYWLGFNNNVTIYNSTTIIGDVTIGSHTWVGPFCALDGSGGLTIGEYCSISTGVQVVTHDTVMWSLTRGKIDRQLAPVKIGSCCYIGSHAIIPKGVSIGDYCVIGAGAVVTQDVPSFSIAAGVPARLIGRVILDESGGINLEYM